MFTQANMKSILFAGALSVICSLLLAGAADMLRERQELNVELDIKKNILKALSIADKELSKNEKPAYYEKLSQEKIQSLYQGSITEQVVDLEGNLQQGMIPSEIPDGDESKLPVYLKKTNGQVSAYAIPISGKGLWSTIKGYFALGLDLNTVKGITFYSHGETPGLGARITEDWFLDNFVGKTISDKDGKLTSVKIQKGKVKASNPNKDHLVDGISGATLTCRGVSSFLEKNLERYQAFFNKLRSANNG